MRIRLIALSATIAAILSPALAQAGRDVPHVGLIVNRLSGMCAGVPTGDAGPGTPATQQDCIDAASQRWAFEVATGGRRLVNRGSGQCLQPAGLAAGGQLEPVDCGGDPRQRFKLRRSGDWVALVNAASMLCVAVEGESIYDGARLVQAACDGSAPQQWTLSGPAAVSKWSPKIALPIVPAAASTLRNGKILAWSSYDRFAAGEDQGRTYTTIYDPATNTASERLVSNTGHDMFCPGTATLPDGRILVNGGSSSDKTSIYDPKTNAWTTGAAMNVPRGYQGDTVLSTGEVLTVGGSWSGGEGGKIGEAWSSSGGWRRLPGIVAETLADPDPGGVYRADNHMWLFSAEDGYAFHAGPSARMHWISTKRDGAIRDAGERADDDYSMNGAVAMFRAGELLKVGGAPAYENVQATSAAYTIDFSGGPLADVKVRRQPPMAFPRAFANAVVAPNGQVVIVGGMTHPVPFYDGRSVLIPEIWTPSTGEFRRLAPMTTPRNYHSVATLMLDGRVWSGGGGLCGSCDTNHPDAEILTPPYLLDADGSEARRPHIRSAPANAEPGSKISVTAGGDVTSFALLRLSAVTHSINNDQRRIALSIVSKNGDEFRLKLPSNRGYMIAGDWMLFAMNRAGTPSVAKIVRIR